MNAVRITRSGPNYTVLHYDDLDLLFSYDTPVAAYWHGMGHFVTNHFYSATTTKHVNHFIADTAMLKGGRVHAVSQDFFDSGSFMNRDIRLNVWMYNRLADEPTT